MILRDPSVIPHRRNTPASSCRPLESLEIADGNGQRTAGRREEGHAPEMLYGRKGSDENSAPTPPACSMAATCASTWISAGRCKAAAGRPLCLNRRDACTSASLRPMRQGRLTQTARTPAVSQIPALLFPNLREVVLSVAEAPKFLRSQDPNRTYRGAKWRSMMLSSRVRRFNSFRPS